jgi:hypothetical protein
MIGGSVDIVNAMLHRQRNHHHRKPDPCDLWMLMA